MAETKRLTRKEKIASGVEKAPKRKKAMAERLKAERQDVTRAVLRDSNISDRKMRLVADLIRGMAVEKALAILKHTTKAGAEPMRKLLRSAISNWLLKNEGTRLEDGNLIVQTVFVDPGKQLKRFRPAPQGRAYRIRKRSNHVTLTIGTKEETTN
jgi:large subunit ribosomal protein L22